MYSIMSASWAERKPNSCISRPKISIILLVGLMGFIPNKLHMALPLSANGPRSPAATILVRPNPPSGIPIPAATNAGDKLVGIGVLFPLLRLEPLDSSTFCIYSSGDMSRAVCAMALASLPSSA